MATSPPISVKVPFKRGTTAQNNAYKGWSGEVTIDSTLRTLVVHDGLKIGGERLLRLADLHDVDAQLGEANAAATAAATSASSAATSATEASGYYADVLIAANAADTAAATATAQAVISTDAATAALASANEATSQVTSIGTAVADSQDAANTATTKAGEAATSASTATTKAGEAAASATTATSKAAESSTSAAAALISKNNAATSATNAAASASVSDARADQATLASNTATTKATEATSSAALAELWASKDLTPVAAGKYSAKYYAELAAASAGGMDFSNYARLDGATFTGTVNGITAAMVGLSVVNNTADIDKPVSTATQAALNLKADATALSAKADVSYVDSSLTSALSSKADISYVDSSIAALVDSSPAVLNTLNELATALGNDPNFATTMTTAISLKAPLESPAFTGTVSGVTATMVGLPNVDNTSDVNKPVSTAQQTALNLKLNIADNTSSALLDFSYDPASTTGLTYGYKAGVLRNDNVPHAVAAGTVTLAASAVNYIQMSGLGVVSANVVGFTTGYWPMATATTDVGSITAYTDERGFASVGGGGGGGAAISSSFFLNKKLITSSEQVPTGDNAFSAGPIELADNVVIDVADGSVWTVV